MVSVVDDAPAPGTLVALKVTLGNVELTSNERMALDHALKDIQQKDNILGKVRFMLVRSVLYIVFV
jgi:hypothetical protein